MAPAVLLHEDPVVAGQLVRHGHDVAELGLAALARLDQQPPVAPQIAVQVVLAGQLAVVAEVGDPLLGAQPRRAVQGQPEVARLAPPEVPARVPRVVDLTGVQKGGSFFF